MFHIFLTHLGIIGHLDEWFQFLALMNYATINMRVQMPLQQTDFVFLGYTPSSSISELFGSSNINLLRKLHTAFHDNILLYLPLVYKTFPSLHF